MIQPAVWFPAVQAGTGADYFTERLAAALEREGVRAAITWLPHRAEFAPWLVRKPTPPAWANLVHCNSWLHTRLLPTGLPLVATIHSCVHDTAYDPYKSPAQRLYHRHWIRRVEERALQRASCVTAVSRYTAARSERTFRRSGIVTIHNWINTNIFFPSPRQEPRSPFRLLYVGNPSLRKGVDLLPIIMSQLGDRFELYVTATQAVLRKRGAIPSNIIPVGHINDTKKLVTLYQTCDALLFPTRLEGLSLTTLEAHACGLPIIATTSSSMPEIVQHGVTGFLCPIDSTTDMVQSVLTLSERRDLWLAMRSAAIDQARRFSQTAALTHYLRIYRNLIAHTSLPRTA